MGTAGRGAAGFGGRGAKPTTKVSVTVTLVTQSNAPRLIFERCLSASLQQSLQPRIQSRAIHNSRSGHAKQLSATRLGASSTKATLRRAIIVAFRSLSAQVFRAQKSLILELLGSFGEAKSHPKRRLFVNMKMLIVHSNFQQI